MAADGGGKRRGIDSEPDLEGGLSIGEAVKKIVTAGIGAAFMTEESIRAYLAELKLPKEMLNMVLQSATKSKEELVNRVGNELVKMAHKIDFVKEASRFVEEHKFRVNAEIEVVKRHPGPTED